MGSGICMFNDGSHPTRAVLYARVSKPDQVVHGKSLAAQLDTMRKYCEWREIDVVGEYVERGVSGFKKPLAARPAGTLMLAAIESGEADCIIVASLSRIFRSLSEVGRYVEKWQVGGPLLIALKEGIDTGSSISRFILKIVAAKDEMESEQTGERVSDTMRYMREAGQKYTSRVYGYTVAGNRMGSCLREQEVISGMVTLRAGGHTLKGIADILNNKGEPAPSGNRWHAETVRRILKREQRERDAR